MKNKLRITVFSILLISIALMQSCLHSMISSEESEKRIDLASNQFVSTTNSAAYLGRTKWDANESNVQFTVGESGTVKKICINITTNTGNFTLKANANGQSHPKFLTINCCSPSEHCIENLDAEFSSTDKLSIFIDNTNGASIEWSEAYLIYEK